MSDLSPYLLIVLIGPAIFVAPVLVGGRIWRAHERRILEVAGSVAVIVMASGCVTMVAVGGNDAKLTVRNDSDWPILVVVSAAGDGTIAAGDSEEYTSWGGPGWIDGLIDGVEIYAGPDPSTKLTVRGMYGQEKMMITIATSATGTLEARRDP